MKSVTSIIAIGAFAVLSLVVLDPIGAAAQTPQPPPLALTLQDAIARGLSSNVAMRVEEQKVRAAEGTKAKSLGALLPHLSANLHTTDQILSTAAFGFTGVPGIPALIGPFGIVDARVGVSVPLFDAPALGDLRADAARVSAEEHTLRNTREAVILLVADLYLGAIAETSRVASAQAQVTTAEALVKLASDQKNAGVVAGIDVVRQQVQVQSARQRLLAAQNALDKQKLQLARAIGVSATQPLTLTDQVGYTAAPPVAAADALAQALTARDDVLSAAAKVDAARASRSAASGGHLPMIRLDADYGAIGPSFSTLARTYTVGANVRVPLFEGGAVGGKVQEMDAELRQREAELADLREGVSFDIANAVLDLNTAAAAVEVAKSAQALADEELVEAQDRFRAGVTSTIELVQAQEAVAGASDSYIGSVFAHNVAKAALARAMGVVEERLMDFLGGRR